MSGPVPSALINPPPSSNFSKMATAPPTTATAPPPAPSGTTGAPGAGAPGAGAPAPGPPAPPGATTATATLTPASGIKVTVDGKNIDVAGEAKKAMAGAVAGAKSKAGDAVKAATASASKGPAGMYDSTSLKRWQIQNLDYNFYWIFTMALGFFGVDYWYLGAPLTGILKFLTNISTFGYWWFYDILNATFNRPTIELFGPTMPFFGTTGCAAGRFRQASNLGDPELLAKHMNYVIYGIILVVFGIIGGDSFILGNTIYAVIRIICLISFVGIPIALIWWVYNIVNYLFNADYFLDDAWFYLGAASPDGNKCPSFFDKLFGPIISLVGMITGFTLPTPNPLEDWKKVILKNLILLN
jgi:TM2 domain-containing membrane protein YozV